MSKSPSDVLEPPSTSLRAHNYRWRIARSKGISRYWIRTAFGAEAWLARKEDPPATDSTIIQISTTLHIRSTGISQVHLEYWIARALVHLRFHRPEVACQVSRPRYYDYPGCPSEIVYIMAKNAADVAAWVSRTFRRAIPLCDGLGQASTLKLTNKDILPLSSFKIHCGVNTRDEKAELEVGSRVILVFTFRPVLWDSVSSHIFVGDLLRCTGQLWSAEAQRWDALWQYDWGTETDNLPKSLLEACVTDVSAIGHDFARTRDGYMRKLQEGASGWGLPVSNARGRQQVIQCSLNVSQSQDLMLAVKHFCGPDYTLTHLGHAAMLLALLRVSPVPPDFPSSAPVVSPMLINGRRYLKGEDDDRRYGSCLASAFVDFAPLGQ
ncbi:hypothetical protein LY76DRAFT_580237 [Colletotrichum caudatum]|nr:hypothetical protein LY76DRAFT_580237 [Colletotrichum caudatum]